MPLDNSKTITAVTYNGNEWAVGGGGVNIAETWVLNDELPIFDYTNAIVAFLSNAGLYGFIRTFDNVFGSTPAMIPGSSVVLAAGQKGLAYYKRGNDELSTNPICDVVAIGTADSQYSSLSTNWTDNKFKTIGLSAPAIGDFLTYLQANAVKQ